MRVRKEQKKKNMLTQSLSIGAVACSLITLAVTMMGSTSDTSLRKTTIAEVVVDDIDRKINDNKENTEVLKSDATLSLEERKLKLQERYIQKWLVPDKQEYVQVLENQLPPESLHQEGGACVIDSKIYLIGGGNGTLHDYHALKVIDETKALQNLIKNSLGSQVVSIYDMKDRTTKFGPRFPYPANHIACAKALDGVTIHLTGGFNQAAPKKTEGSFTYHYTLDTSKENANWEQKAHMPLRMGAHGCDFMADNRMYCVGGGVATNGPYSNKMMIYDPVSDTWEMGPNMPTPRDHLYDSTIAIQGRKKLYVAGGRTHIQELHPDKSNPAVFANTNVVEIYDMDTKKWSRAKDILSLRAAIGVIPYARNMEKRKNKEPNLLLVGGEQFHGESGMLLRIIEEYDVINDLYYCLKQLTWPWFGGALGIHDGTLHVVGGAEWVGLSATRRVQLYDLERAPSPRQCFYDSVPVFDQWERTWNQVKPWPNINEE